MLRLLWFLARSTGRINMGNTALKMRGSENDSENSSKNWKQKQIEKIMKMPAKCAALEGVKYSGLNGVKKSVCRFCGLSSKSVTRRRQEVGHSTALVRQEVVDIDAWDKYNLEMVSEYVNDIYDYLYEVEQQQPIFKDHLAGQKEVSPQKRAILLNWINQVHQQFCQAQETFQLAVAIIDRYLQVVRDTKQSDLQLVGITGLYIALKYEERIRPPIDDMVSMTAYTYTAQQLRQMEVHIIMTIDCNLSRPLPVHFLRRYSKAANMEDEHHYVLSQYFIELAAVDYELASARPSEIAAASLLLSLHLLNDDQRLGTGFNGCHWTSTLSFYSRYSAVHLRPIVRRIAMLARAAPQAKLRAVFRKYRNSEFHKIALRKELRGSLMDSIIGQSP